MRSLGPRQGWRLFQTPCPLHPETPSVSIPCTTWHAGRLWPGRGTLLQMLCRTCRQHKTPPHCRPKSGFPQNQNLSHLHTIWSGMTSERGFLKSKTRTLKFRIPRSRVKGQAKGGGPQPAVPGQASAPRSSQQLFCEYRFVVGHISKLNDVSATFHKESHSTPSTRNHRA